MSDSTNAQCYIHLMLRVSLLLVLTSIALTQSALGEDLIFAEPVKVVPTLENSLEIVGIRKSSNSFTIVDNFDGSGTGKQLVYVNERALVGSWLKDETFAGAVMNAKINAPSVSNIALSGIDVENFDWSKFNSLKPTQEAIFSYKNGDELDARVITAMTAAGYFDLKKQSSIVQQEGMWVPIKSEYSEAMNDFIAAMKVLEQNSKSPLSQRQNGPTEIFQAANNKLGIVDALRVPIGKASFGKSLVKSAEEVGFKVQESLKKNFDIYLIEFATTLYDVQVNSVSELSFKVKCDDICTAWELAPIKVESEEEVETKLNSPALSVKGFEIGEMYSRTLRFKRLRPIIVAYGLRESEFSWSLKGEAMSQGSHQFLAAIGVPKGTKNVQFEKSFAVRTTGYVFEGDWADAGVLTESVRLKN